MFFSSSACVGSVDTERHVRKSVPSRRTQPFLGVAPPYDSYVFGDRFVRSDEDRQDDRQENQSAQRRWSSPVCGGSHNGSLSIANLP